MTSGLLLHTWRLIIGTSLITWRHTHTHTHTHGNAYMQPGREAQAQMSLTEIQVIIHPIINSNVVSFFKTTEKLNLHVFPPVTMLCTCWLGSGTKTAWLGFERTLCFSQKCHIRLLQKKSGRLTFCSRCHYIKGTWDLLAILHLNQASDKKPKLF